MACLQPDFCAVSDDLKADKERLAADFALVNQHGAIGPAGISVIPAFSNAKGDILDFLDRNAVFLDQLAKLLRTDKNDPRHAA